MTTSSLDHHIKKLIAEKSDHNFSDVSDEATTIVCGLLMNKHAQYKLERNLNVEVKKSLERLNASSQLSVATPVKTPALFIHSSGVESLNKSISVQYASKRSRPTEPRQDDENIIVDGVHDTTLLDSVDISGGIADQDTARNEDSQPPKKVIRKVNKKRQTLGTGEATDPDATSAVGSMIRNIKSLSFLATRPTARLADLAGLEPVQQQIKELVFFPILYPHLYSRLGVTPPCGILLHGPSGCGKTTLACAIAGELNLPFFKASGPELVGGTSGESEERVRQIFEAAAAQAPSVLFIDALDVIAGKKDASQRGMERRIVAQLFDSIDYISSLSKPTDEQTSNVDENGGPGSSITDSGVTGEDVRPKSNGIVVLIVATNKPDSIDPGVRGRFSREIALPVPDAPSRTKILKLMTNRMHIAESVDFEALGKATPGFVGADLQALTREAGMIAVSRIVAASGLASSLSDAISSGRGGGADLSGSVEMADFTLAAKSIQPTAKREGFAVAPDVTWSDVGALSEVREELLHNVLEPIAHPERFRSLGLEVPAGVLFFGPPGCGKTLLAKALANQSGANFISVKGPELLNMYVGESESRVRQVFARARASAPCVIFFDELDALCPKRGGAGDGEGGGGSGNGVSERVVNQLLTELDGLESRRDVYIIAATNRLELIDDAMLRPGRLGKLLYVPLPSAADRVSILRALTRKVSVNIDGSADLVDLEAIGSDPRCEGFSGADLAALVREAGLAVVREIIDANSISSSGVSETAISSSGTENNTVPMSVDTNTLSAAGDVMEGVTTSSSSLPEVLTTAVDQYSNLSICGHHFQTAFKKVKASVSDSDRARYVFVQENIKNGMGAIQALKDAAEKMVKLRRMQKTASLHSNEERASNK